MKKRDLSEKSEKLQTEITYLVQLLQNIASSNKTEVVKQNPSSLEKVVNDREVRLENEIAYLLSLFDSQVAKLSAAESKLTKKDNEIAYLLKLIQNKYLQDQKAKEELSSAKPAAEDQTAKYESEISYLLLLL